MTTNIQQVDHRLREINRLKRQLSFGNIPPFYHAVATSLGMAEGMLKYGFENSLDVLTNPDNWNVQLLGGKHDGIKVLECQQKPRLSIYKVFTANGFEVHCVPWKGEREFDFELANHPQMDFKFWRPTSMKVVFRLAQLHTFIKMYFQHGDEADLQLIRCAHHIAEEFIDHLIPQFNTQKVYGVSIHNFFEFARKKHQAGEAIYLPNVYAFQDN